MASSERTPFAARPSPSRTIREKASTTRKPDSAGRATRSRQLLVPRSRAAYCGAKRCAATYGRPAGLKSGPCERPLWNRAGTGLPLVRTALGNIGASAGAAARAPDGLLVPSGFSTGSNPLSSKHDLQWYRSRTPNQNPTNRTQVPDGAGNANPLHARSSLCYHFPARMSPARGKHRMGDRLTVGQRTLTPPV